MTKGAQHKSKTDKSEGSSVEEKTLKELRKLNKEMALFNSRKQVFLRGIIRGLGAAIGATIIAAIAFTILSYGLRAIDDLPVIRNIIDGTNLQQGVEE